MSDIHDLKAQILQELAQTPDDFYFGELLHFIQFLKERYQLELQADLSSIQAAKDEIQREGTIPLEQVRQQLGA